MTEVVRLRATVLVRRTFVVLLAWGAFATCFLGAERTFRAGTPVSLAAGAAVAAAFLAVVLGGGERLAEAVARLAVRAEKVPAGRWLAGCVAAAAGVRLAWGALLTPRQVSDMELYYAFARSLAERGVFEHGGDRVFGPPGVSLLLAPLVKLFGAGTWLPLAVNVALAAGTVLVAGALALLVADGRTMRIATLLVALWPNAVLLSGLVSKELLVLFLLPLGALLYLRATEGAGSDGKGLLLAAGLALGAATLAQPNTLVLLPAFAALELLRRAPLRSAVLRLGLLGAGTALAVSPWTVRNALLFGRFVPVSVNFGHAMLVGNHDGADGGFRPVRTPYLGMPEIEYDRLALRKALDWIRENPGRFLALVPRKQMVFLGDDGDGAYHALKWAYGIGDARYALAKAVSNGWWVGVLALAAVALSGRRGREADRDPRLALGMFFFFCLLALLSVTESGSRHHLALSPFLALLAGLLARPAGDASSRA